tara:strand:+ start:1715 stop:8155 length:6441 start_codon:yes stop_codon:yes gene_type:complete
MSTQWNPNESNSVQLDDGTVVEIPIGISAAQAYEFLVEAGRITPSELPEEEEKSGFFPGISSSIENIKGTFTGALPATAAGLEITGTEDQRRKYLESSQAIYEASREAQMEELPDPASVDSIKEAYKDGGAWDALSETWDFSKEAVGQQVPIFGGLMAAQKLGGSKLVSNSLIGRAGTALLGRAIPAAVAPYVAASFSNPWTGAAAALALSAAFAYSSMLRDNAESAEDLEDIKVLRAATAAAPHAAMEYLGFAMTGAFGPLKQQLAAATLKDTLAGASTVAGRSAWGAAGKQAAKSLTEFPTELAQTVIERAQAGESISLSDADFVNEMINVAAATAPVVGVFGGYGGYRSYKNEKSNKKEFEKKTDLEKAHRTSVAEARRITIEKQEANARRIADEGVARYEAAVGLANSRDEGIARQVERMAERTPVEYADIAEALDSRGVTPDNVFNSGTSAFIFRNTDGKVKSLHQLKDSLSLSKAERDQRAKYRRRIYSILSGMGSFEYVGANKDAPLTFNQYTTKQFDDVLKATRKFKGKAEGTRINQNNIRKILKMGNSGVEQNIASAIKKDLKLDGYSETSGSVQVARNPGYTEIQYRKIMDRAREKGRFSQELYEQVTNNYGREYYTQFIQDVSVRGGLDPVQAKKNIYIPMRAKKGIGYVDVKVEPDTPGFFIRHEGEIVGGATTRPMAESVISSLEHRSRSYTVTKNGKRFKTFKNKSWADQISENEFKINPDDVFDVVTNPVATFNIDKTKTPGFKVVERFRDDEGNIKDIYEDSFAPTREIAESRREVRESEYSVGESSWDRNADKRREQAMQDLFYGPRERGLYQDPVLQDYLPKKPEFSEQELRIIETIDNQLKDMGVSDFKGKVEKEIKTGDRFAAGEFSALMKTVSVALDQFGDAQTDAEIDQVLREVVDHEVIHAMRELDLFSQNEWLALTRSVSRIKIPKALRNRNRELFKEDTTFLEWAQKNYDGIPSVEVLKNRKNPDEYWDYILEEAVAELHSSYKNSPEVSDQVDGTTESLLDKVRRFFERVYNSITGVGYGDVGDVFAAIGTGTIGKRKRGEIRTFKTGPKYASVDQLAKPRSERERRDSDLNETRGGVAVNVEEDETKKSLASSMRESGKNFTAELPEANEQFGQKFLEETLEQTPGFVPRISSRPEKNLNLRPDLDDRSEIRQRSIDIANGVVDPVKFSLADKQNSNPRRKRRSGNLSYEELKARTVPERTEKTFIDYIKEIWQEKSLAMFRQKFIDKYDSIAKLSKRAAAKRMERGDDHMLLANVNAASAAYLSENAQGVVAESITSGQPVYSGGIVRVDYEKPGVFEILKDVYQQGFLEDFHLWVMSKRSHRLGKDNKLTPVAEKDIAEIEDYIDSQPGMRELFERTNEQYQEWNENLVNFLRETGVIDERLGEVLKSYGDYVPFYKQYEGEAYDDEANALSQLIGQSIDQMKETIDPRTGETIIGEAPIVGRDDAPNSMFGSLVGAKPPKKLRKEGSDEMVVPMLEGIMRNLQAAVSSGAKNIAAQRTLRDALVFGNDIAVKLDKKSDAEFASDVVTVRENGVDQHYQLKDKLLFDSLSGMMEGKLPWLSFFSLPSDVLRNLVTRSPDFIMANLMRDSISTWVTSGSKMTPMIGTFSNFFKGGIRASKNQDPSMVSLLSSGVIGGYDNSRYPKDLQKTFDKRMREEGLTVSGKKRGLTDKAVFNTMQKLWDWSGDVTTKSDAATRMAVYEDVYKNILSKGHTREEAEAEAIFQAQEVINFSRRGNSGIARVVTAAIPFLNARVQGLDVLWRAGRGNYSSDYSKAGQKSSMYSFLGRGSMLAAITGMYALMAHDEDDWLSASSAEQDDNWIIPGYGVVPGFKIPIPFEIGILFKVVPERLMRASLSGENYLGVDIPEGGKTDWRQAGNALSRGVISSLKLNPFEAQVTKPFLESYVNYSFFTGQPIVPMYMEDRLPEQRKRNGTNAMAIALGETFGASPLKIEHIMRGYTGTVGSWILFASDHAIRSMSNMPAKPALRIDQWPLLKRFLQTDLGSQGQLSNFYEFRKETKKFVNSLNQAIEEGDVETQQKILERYPQVEGIQKYMNEIDTELGKLRNYQSEVYLSDMSPEKKLEIMNKIDEKRKIITRDVNKLRSKMDLPFNPLADF